MNYGRTVFAQLLDFLSLADLRKCIERYGGNYRVRRFSCLDQFLAMAYAQLAFRDSLRDIEVTLRSFGTKLYHSGFRSRPSRSTLADANENRDWRIWADFAGLLIEEARRLYAGEPFAADIDAAAYTLDTTTIDLCMSLFPWAYHQHSKSAVKMHTLMNLRGNIPEFIHITGPDVYDTCLLDMIVPEPGAFYVMDRGFIDFARLAALDQGKAFFVVRAKRNLKARRRYSHPKPKEGCILSDHTVALSFPRSRRAYEMPLRRIRFKDEKTGQRLAFITNNFILPSTTIVALYKARWQIEVFFKLIKQNLKIKAFFGTSPNAVKTQLWIAITAYVLVAIMKKQLKIKASLHTILQVLSVNPFVKTRIQSLFQGENLHFDDSHSHNQLQLF